MVPSQATRALQVRYDALVPLLARAGLSGEDLGHQTGSERGEGGGRGEPETKDPPRGHYERAWDESDRRRRERGRGVMVIMVMVSEK